jgi:hypothetical protein
MRSAPRLQCPKCGEKLQAGDTTIIKIPKPAFEERKHYCPRCNAIIALEIGANDDTQTALPDFDETFTRADFF